MLTTLDHIVIAVRDLAASSDVYVRLLGRRPSWRGVHPGYGTANTLFRLENTYLELLSPNGAGAVADLLLGFLEQRGEGLFALAFGTADAAAFARAARERGLAAADPVDGSGKESATGVERRWRNVFIPESETRGVKLFAIEHRTTSDLLPAAEPTDNIAASVSGCDHVVVNTTESDRASELYGAKLGLRLALDKKFPDWSMRLLFFRIGGITVELAAPLGAIDSSGEDRLWGVSYRTPDAEAARARLLRQGFEVSEVRSGRKPGTRVCTVHGEPCGVATLLIARDDLSRSRDG
jgi:catechol 2,3-dioxygenase-like lactoylglutathione lyase family enzyme